MVKVTMTFLQRMLWLAPPDQTEGRLSSELDITFAPMDFLPITPVLSETFITI